LDPVIRSPSLTDIFRRRLDGDVMSQEALRCRVRVWAPAAYTTPTQRGTMATRRRRLRSVRVLEGAVRLATAARSSSTSNNNTGRLEASLEADLEDLRMLAMNGSEQKFNEALQTAIVRLVRLTRKLLR